MNPAAFIPPDVTHQTTDNKPDLIQDVVTQEQPDLTKGGRRPNRQLEQYVGEPEKVLLIHLIRF